MTEIVIIMLFVGFMEAGLLWSANSLTINNNKYQCHISWPAPLNPTASPTAPQNCAAVPFKGSFHIIKPVLFTKKKFMQGLDIGIQYYSNKFNNK